MHPLWRVRALEDLCTRSYVPVASSIVSRPATWSRLKAWCSQSDEQDHRVQRRTAVSGEPAAWQSRSSAKVTAEILGEGRGDKILVFHLKRKKQYKKLQGHRQNFTEVRIKAIEADGVTYTERA